MTDNAGIKTKRGRVRKHSLGEVLYYAFVVPQPDGPRRMVRKARVPRVYKCAHIRDIRSGCGRKQRKKSHIRGRPQQTWYCGWLRIRPVTARSMGGCPLGRSIERPVQLGLNLAGGTCDREPILRDIR